MPQCNYDKESGIHRWIVVIMGTHVTNVYL